LKLCEPYFVKLVEQFFVVSWHVVKGKEMQKEIPLGNSDKKGSTVEEWIESGSKNLLFNQEMQDCYKHVQQRIARALEKGEDLEVIRRELILEQYEEMFNETLGKLGVPREKFFTLEFMEGFQRLLQSQRNIKDG
jgi:hypothetical protein